MSDDRGDLEREIVIVKRRKGGGDEGHHGGVWKIAYADFMTAMMAFFLVMWLVNMTDDETVVQIANYFNPLQLTDRKETTKGVYDDRKETEDPPPAEDTKKSEKDAKPRTPGRARMEKARREKAAVEEAKLFIDPLETLDGVAKSEGGAVPEAGPQESLAGLDEKAIPLQQFPTGPDVFDPFDPYQERADEQVVRQSSTDAGEQGKAGERLGEPPSGTPSQATMKEQSRSNPANKALVSMQDRSEKKIDERDVKLAEAIKASLIKAVEGLRHDLPSISVEPDAEGVLVSIMDRDEFGMFQLGSSEPLPQTVRLFDRLGAIILSTKRNLVVRGHTDAAPFKQSSYDNWRLSTARAHMAHYMLRRAGVADAQLEKIEGYASSKLRNSKNPLASENRRIEFLLRVTDP